MGHKITIEDDGDNRVAAKLKVPQLGSINCKVKASLAGKGVAVETERTRLALREAKLLKRSMVSALDKADE
jgi:hypothetical protein